MSNEEFERMMEFILGQQAQFSANIQGHDERLARLEELVGRIGERVDQLGEHVDHVGGQLGQLGEHVGQIEELVNRLAAATLAGFKDVNAKIDALVDSQIRLTDAQARTEEARARTEASQARTDEALRNLIDTVERYINERRNGG